MGNTPKYTLVENDLGEQFYIDFGDKWIDLLYKNSDATAELLADANRGAEIAKEVWTTELPTEPGFYWHWRRGPGRFSGVVKLKQVYHLVTYSTHALWTDVGGEPLPVTECKGDYWMPAHAPQPPEVIENGR